MASQRPDVAARNRSRRGECNAPKDPYEIPRNYSMVATLYNDRNPDERPLSEQLVRYYERNALRKIADALISVGYMD